MTKKCLLFLFIFVCVTSFSFAKDIDTQKALKEYTKTLDKIEKNTQKDLVKLKYSINSKHVNDAVKLKKAFDHIQSKRFDAAYSLLKKIKKSSPLSDYARCFSSLVLEKKHNLKKAFKILPDITNPCTKIEWDIFWQRISLLAEQGKTNDMTTILAPIQKNNKKNKWVKIKSSYYLGLSEHYLGNKKIANEYFIKVLIEYPGTEYDNKIFKLLGIHKIKPTPILSTTLWLKRADKLAGTGFVQQALEIVMALNHNNQHNELVAKAHFKARRYDKAADLYEELIELKPELNTSVEYWDKRAHAYLRHDDFKNAEKAFQYIVKNFPKTNTASIARFKLGFLYFDSEQYKKANTYFSEFTDKGSSWTRNRANWFQFWSLYLLKDYKNALDVSTSLISKYKRNSKIKESLTYWQARIYDKLNNKEKAKEIYTSLYNSDNLSYYGLLSQQRLMHNALQKDTLIAKDVLSVVPHSTNNAKPVDHSNLKNLNKKDPLLKAILLYHLGFDNYAFDESRQSELIKNITDYQTAKTFEYAGNFNRGYGMRFLAQKDKLTGANLNQGFELSYPQAYEQYASPFAKIWEINESLIYAVMRQESAFKPEALSYAFAYGLMQIIPPTGKEIAGNIAFKDFHTYDLNKPKVNVFFGSYYLRHLLDTFDNNMIFAIAAYNAGPDALKRWSKKAKNMEMDEFIELIPYIETNDYVKKVLVNYLVYERLY